MLHIYLEMFTATHLVDGSPMMLLTVVPLVGRVSKWPSFALADPFQTKRGTMPKYKVTGGPDKTAGVTISDKWYGPGEIVEAASTKVRWLVEQDYLAATAKAPVKAASTPDLEEEAL